MKKPENEKAQNVKRNSGEIRSRRFDPSQSHFIQGRQDSGNETAITPAMGKQPKVISQNGKCGHGVICEGSVFGNCCSKEGYCGNGPLYCGEGQH